MAGKERTHLAALASLAVLGILASGCAGAASRAAEGVAAPARPYVVQDPENPAARNYLGPAAVGTGSTGRAFILRDPENPYWSGHTMTPQGSQISEGTAGQATDGTRKRFLGVTDLR